MTILKSHPRIHSNKASFTLIEIIIVLTLIAVGTCSLGITIPKALKKLSFEKGVDALIQKIELAQEIMLDYRCDLTLSIFCEKGTIFTNITPHHLLPEHIKKSLNRKCMINGIKKITFNHQDPPLEMHFEGSLGAIPYGYLVCISQKDLATIALKGYPAPIMRGEKLPEIKHVATYPKEIFSSP